MKKVLPILLILVFVLTGIASADAPFRLNILITNTESDYSTSVIVYSGDQVAIRLGETNVTLDVQEKQEDGLNFKFDPALQYNDENHGITDVSDLLLPAGVENKYTEAGKDSPVLTISWEELTLPAAYEEIISNAAEVLNGNHEADTGTISSLFHQMAGTQYAENVGFFVTDLDGDGTPELFLGENQPQSDSTIFYDMFALKGDELVHVFNGWDRSRYYLCSNGGIANEGSSSAFESFTAYYYYTDGTLKLMQSLIYNSNTNPDNPWRLSTSSAYEVSDADQMMTESEAMYTKAMYPYSKVTLEPFAK